MTAGGLVTALEYGVDSVPMPGELESGDLYVVREFPTGIVVGVIDGLGHGAEAAVAARVAAATIQSNAGKPIEAIAGACDRELRNTRGAVLALIAVSFVDDSLEWLGIGNVEGGLARMDPAAAPGYEILVAQPGVVGYGLPHLSSVAMSIFRDDMLILATDGIRTDYAVRVALDLRRVDKSVSGLKVKPWSRPGRENISGPADPALLASLKDGFSPRNLAAYIRTNFMKGSDDALVFVARYRGIDPKRHPDSGG